MARVVQSMLVRAERQPTPQHLVATFVDPGSLTARLSNDNNEILYGRRGTGKTHVLRVLAATRGGLAVYVDMRKIAETLQVGDGQLPPEIHAARLLQLLLRTVADDIAARTSASDLRGRATSALRAFRATVDRRVLLDQHLAEEAEATRHVGSETGAGLTFSATAPEIHASVSSTDDATNRGLMRREGTRAVANVMYADVIRDLIALLDAVDAPRMLLLIDEWTEVPYRLQPLFAECIRRTFFTSSRITVKIASVEYRSTFVERYAEHGAYIGIDVGAEISTGLVLDDLLVYQRDPDHVTESFAELLFRHLAAGAIDLLDEGQPHSVRLLRRARRKASSLSAQVDEVRGSVSDGGAWSDVFADLHGSRIMRERLGIGSSKELVEELFSQGGDSFEELVYASGGVVRDFIHLFARAFNEARDRHANRIDLPRIRSVARDWLNDDKARNLSPEQEDLLHQITEYIRHNGTTDLFAISREAEAHSLMQGLLDLRLMYLVGRRRTIQGYPRPVNQYAVDYGAYVDLVEKLTHQRGGRGVLSASQAPTLFIPDEALGLSYA